MLSKKLNLKDNIKGGGLKSNKVKKIIAATLVGTNLFSILVGGSSVFATENNSLTQGIADPIMNLNKVSDGEFENDYKSNKQSWEYRSGGKGVRTSENGNYFGRINTGSISDHILQVVSTTPGKTYRVSADIKVTVDNNKATSGVFFTAKRQTATGGQGAVYNELQFTSKTNGWERKEFEFTADSNKTYVGIVKWAGSDPTGVISKTTIAMDNIEVIEQDVTTVVWEDDFTGNTLNQDVWGYELGSIRGNEQQHYVDSKDNVFLEDGNLVLKVTDRAVQDQYMNPRGGSSARKIIYNSGSVRTHGNMEFLYGRIEMKAKLPKGKGAFPAFWTLGSDFMLDGDINSAQGYSWPSTGEIDIMEIIGAPTAERAALGEVASGGQSNKIAYGTPHFYYASASDPDKDGSYAPYALGGSITLDEDFYDDYHVFGINWSPDKIEWYVDGVVYNTMYFSGDARLLAAAASLNRPQYIQFNLATGGNWAGNAGLHLAEDDTRFEIDWVRWTQNAEQKAAYDAYYSTNPNIVGAKDITMIQGQAPNLLAGVSVDKANYLLDFSIDDEYMFSNSGGNTNVTLRVSNSQDLTRLNSLTPGVYNIHYSAYPQGVNLSGWVTPSYRVKRETVLLVVLPNGLDKVSGNEGDLLLEVDLPNGFTWKNPNEVLNSEGNYEVLFKNIEAGEVQGKERVITITIPGNKIVESL